ncbi:unnamed protein product [Urochloa decumbens]|uniref:Uncharacterized protein n=1 Tax=Urochloa decumbens TaxID=240449 RepID=A0ABC9DE91_9POAL
MAARALKIAVSAMIASTIAVQLPSFLDPSATATAISAKAAEPSPPLDAAVLQILLPFAVMEALFAAVPFLYRRAAAAAAAADGAGAGNNRRRLRLSELVSFISCVAVSLLEHFLFTRRAGGAAAADGGAVQARRALGLAALRALPASAAATFFLGVALLYAHLAGGNRPVPEPAAVRILTEMTLEAAAALIGIMVTAVCTL